MKKTIGIIGGMGPKATIDLFNKIVDFTPAKKDQEHLHIIIDNNPKIPDRTNAILNNTEEPVEYLIDSAKRLENAGADVIIMACNTAHYFMPYVEPAVKIPFISIIDCVIEELKSHNNVNNVAVLSTVGTQKSLIYDNKLIKNGFNVVKLPDNIQNDIMYCIYDGVKTGEIDKVIPLFQKTLSFIEENLKADIFVAACTEIPLLTKEIKIKNPILDATALLVAGELELPFRASFFATQNSKNGWQVLLAH